MANEKENLQTEEEVETVQTEAADETAETQAGTEESALSALQAQYDELNDRYLRMAAEYDNFRKRSRAERDSVHAEAVAYAVKALLATVDNLSRALAQPTEDAAYKQGIEMTMIHYFFTGPGVVLMRNIGVPVPLQIPAAAIVAFGVSWLLVVFIRKISGKNAKYIVG